MNDSPDFGDDNRAYYDKMRTDVRDRISSAIARGATSYGKGLQAQNSLTKAQGITQQRNSAPTGALTGAAIGSMISPGVGTAIGAGIGGLAGIISSFSAHRKMGDSVGKSLLGGVGDAFDVGQALGAKGGGPNPMLMPAAMAIGKSFAPAPSTGAMPVRNPNGIGNDSPTFHFESGSGGSDSAFGSDSLRGNMPGLEPTDAYGNPLKRGY